jgi:cytochrome c oxidase cbb3-type subunit I/II
MAMIESNVPKIASVKPYTPLELAGRDLYIREGCLGCHSQMVRPFRSETARYGEYSKSGEYIYDRPFLWGSKRTGPDIHRVGGKYPDTWHYNHMYDPLSMSPGSIMPAYPWLIRDKLNVEQIPKKIKVLRTLGTPYAKGYEKIALDDLEKQAAGIAQNLKKDGIKDEKLAQREIIAMIAYLQRLGTDIKVKAPAN